MADIYRCDGCGYELRAGDRSVYIDVGAYPDCVLCLIRRRADLGPALPSSYRSDRGSQSGRSCCRVRPIPDPLKSSSLQDSPGRTDVARRKTAGEVPHSQGTETGSPQADSVKQVTFVIISILRGIGRGLAQHGFERRLRHRAWAAVTSRGGHGAGGFPRRNLAQAGSRPRPEQTRSSRPHCSASQTSSAVPWARPRTSTACSARPSSSTAPVPWSSRQGWSSGKVPLLGSPRTRTISAHAQHFLDATRGSLGARHGTSETTHDWSARRRRNSRHPTSQPPACGVPPGERPPRARNNRASGR